MLDKCILLCSGLAEIYMLYDFFENLLERRTNSYEREGNAYEQYTTGWLDFQNSLKEGDSVRMNLLLKSINSYSIEQNGNWISINA